MGTLWPLSNQMAFTNAGVLAPAAKVYFYEAGTSTPKAVYSNADETAVRTQPVSADGNGRWPAIFVPFGSYKYLMTTSGGSAMGATVDNVPNAAPTNPSDTVDANSIAQTGDYLFVGKNGTRDGYVRCNGRTIGSASSAATERANPDTADLFAYLWNNYANGQCAVSGGRGASAAADFAANKTIATPDHRGAALIGFDDMGNVSSGVLAGVPVYSGSGILAGSILGLNTHTLTTAQLASHTHPFATTTGAGSAHIHPFTASVSSEGAHTHTGTTDNGGVDHTHAYTSSTANFTIGYDAGASSLTAADDTSPGQITNGASAFLHTHTFTTASSGSHTHAVTGNTNAEASHTHAVSGTSDASGGGTAHNNLPWSIVVTVLMKL